ncbi:MAG: dienelactone hydrolase family protein [Myxococcota bacterium]|nr:dienelactone hydrolase family protein [Myxococcota bacterium]
MRLYPFIGLVIGLAYASPAWGQSGIETFLEYEEVITGGAQPSDPLPMVVALHGYGDTPSNFARLWRAFPKPARFVVLRAPQVKGRGFSWFRIVRPIDFSDHPTSHEILNVAVAIVNTVHLVSRTRPTVGKPVVTGFSQGGILSLTLALHYPDVFAAALPIAGTVPRRFQAVIEPPAPVYAFHGTADRVVSLSSLNQGKAAFSAGGRPINVKTYRDVRHRVTPEMRRDIYARLTDELNPAGKNAD